MKFLKQIPLAAWLPCALLLLCATACKSDYESLVEKGLKSGIRNDSLFLGIHFGMTDKEFYAHCWELNKERLIKQGNTNTSVEYEMSELKSPAQMNFYPTFHNGAIHEMPVLFNYKAWAPWNRNLWADSLLLDVKILLEQWHGPGFIKMEKTGKEPRFVKVDGNRRILLWKENDQYVKALYTDLTKENEMNQRKEETKARAGRDGAEKGL